MSCASLIILQQNFAVFFLLLSELSETRQMHCEMIICNKTAEKKWLLQVIFYGHFFCSFSYIFCECLFCSISQILCGCFFRSISQILCDISWFLTKVLSFKLRIFGFIIVLHVRMHEKSEMTFCLFMNSIKWTSEICFPQQWRNSCDISDFWEWNFQLLDGWHPLHRWWGVLVWMFVKSDLWLLSSHRHRGWSDM